MRNGRHIAVKVTRNENGWRRKKTKDPAKFGVRKKKKIGHVGARGVRSLWPSHSSLRPALWTISTSGKALDVQALTNFILI